MSRTTAEAKDDQARRDRRERIARTAPALKVEAYDWFLRDEDLIGVTIAKRAALAESKWAVMFADTLIAELDNSRHSEWCGYRLQLDELLKKVGEDSDEDKRQAKLQRIIDHDETIINLRTEIKLTREILGFGSAETRPLYEIAKQRLDINQKKKIIVNEREEIDPCNDCSISNCTHCIFYKIPIDEDDCDICGATYKQQAAGPEFAPTECIDCGAGLWPITTYKDPMKILSDAEKLELLANWFDKLDNSNNWIDSNEVQIDLRRMATIIDENKRLRKVLEQARHHADVGKPMRQMLNNITTGEYEDNEGRKIDGADASNLASLIYLLDAALN